MKIPFPRIRHVYKVRVTYENGTSVEIWLRQFGFKKNEGETEVKWESFRSQKPLFANVNEIYSVYCVDRKFAIVWD